MRNAEGENKPGDRGIRSRAYRLVGALAGVALVTLTAYRLIPVNATTVAFAYLLSILIVASWWGFIEAAVASLAAALAFNFFFLPPVGTLTISDPQNWVALFSFLATSLIASRLSAKAERRARDAIAHQRDIERLYSFSRSILLMDTGEPFSRQLIRKVAEIFEVSAVALYDRRSGQLYRAGPSELEEAGAQVRDAALHGTSFSGPNRAVTAVRLGSEPIAGLALEVAGMPDSVLQGIANLVAIGLERARAQELEHQFEAARESQQLRNTLIDAMAHEFKTPLTSVRAATTALLSNHEQWAESSVELLRIADEEAKHLEQLIDDAVEMARLDTAEIELHPERCDAGELVREAAALIESAAQDGRIEILREGPLSVVGADRRLMKLAIKQLVENALKYSPPGTPVTIRTYGLEGIVYIEVSDRGPGIPPEEQSRIFDRFYRSPSVQRKVPGSGLGLSIAQSIVKAHGGELKVDSGPGGTKFRMALPAMVEGERL